MTINLKALQLIESGQSGKIIRIFYQDLEMKTAQEIVQGEGLTSRIRRPLKIIISQPEQCGSIAGKVQVFGFLVGQVMKAT
jgi:Asp-tRNA(Asn)/Glu-tRNA(Gln) amidotransferase B subunit